MTPAPTPHPVPAWIRRWAAEYEGDGVTLAQALEESRRISRKFKTPLSRDIIRERREGR